MTLVKRYSVLMDSGTYDSLKIFAVIFHVALDPKKYGSLRKITPLKVNAGQIYHPQSS